MTGVKLEKKADIGKYFFVEKELRRGVSYIAKSILKQATNTSMTMSLKSRQNL